MKLDCDALITADDFQKVCHATVTITKMPSEGQSSRFDVCSRRIAMGSEFPFGNFMLNVYADAESAAALWTAEGKGVKEIAGVGDKAWVQETRDGDFADAWIKARKGKIGFWLRSHSEPGVRSPCTLDQLVELARLAASRLP